MFSLGFDTYWTYGGQTTQVGGVKRTRDTAGSETLQHEGDTENIESLADKVVDGAGARPGVVFSKGSLQEVFKIPLDDVEKGNKRN
jgi:hypothetical protein